MLSTDSLAALQSVQQTDYPQHLQLKNVVTDLLAATMSLICLLPFSLYNRLTYPQHLQLKHVVTDLLAAFQSVQQTDYPQTPAAKARCH